MRLPAVLALVLLSGFAAVSNGASRNNCERGQFSPRSDVKCEQCKPGTFSMVPRATGCMTCPHGYFAMAYGSAYCSPCLPGYHASGRGNAFCRTCRSGHYASEYRSAECRKCPKGHFASRAGSIACTECPVNSYAGSLGQARCSPCPTGSHASQTGSERCQLPKDQVWALANGACPADSYPYTAGRCKKCSHSSSKKQHKNCYTQVNFVGCYQVRNSRNAFKQCKSAYDSDSTSLSQAVAMSREPFWRGYLSKKHQIKKVVILPHPTSGDSKTKIRVRVRRLTAGSRRQVDASFGECGIIINDRISQAVTCDASYTGDAIEITQMSTTTSLTLADVKVLV